MALSRNSIFVDIKNFHIYNNFCFTIIYINDIALYINKSGYANFKDFKIWFSRNN